MAGALEAGYDLAALALLFVALALLLATKQIAAGLAGAFDVSILGVRPFHRVAVAIENGIIGALDDAIKGVEKLAAKFESGLIDSFGLLIALPILLYLGVKAALTYLWDKALRPVIHSIADPIRAVAEKGLARANDARAAVELAIGETEAYALGRAEWALATAKAQIGARLDALASDLRGDIGAALHSAERYADQAVARLRSAEDLAVAEAVGLAAEAKAAGLAAGAAALHAAEAELGAGLAAEAARRAAELAQLDAAGKAALATVRSVAVNVEEELHTIEGAAGAVGVAALIAAIPAISTLVHSIATEAGLENADCRSKVKGICGTNPSGWGDLIAGLGLLGLGFSLRELAEVARPVAAELAVVIREAA